MVITATALAVTDSVTSLRDSTNRGGSDAITASAASSEESAVSEGLTARGHNVIGVVRGSDRKMFGWGHVILRDPATGVLWAGSEPRCDGCAIPAVL